VITLNSLGASLVDKPVAQHHGSATQLQSHLVQHIARARPHKQAERGNRRASKHLAQFGQPKMTADGLTTGGSLDDRNEREPQLKRVSAERDKEQNGRARRSSEEQDEDQDGRARRFSKEQDEEQDGFRSAPGKKRSNREPP
jgi:hypothetical protein